MKNPKNPKNGKSEKSWIHVLENLENIKNELFAKSGEILPDKKPSKKILNRKLFSDS